MKEKILKVLKNKASQCVIALVLALLMTMQEINLGNPTTAWTIGAIVPIAFGGLFEVFRLVVYEQRFGDYNIKNVLPWIIGGIAGVVIAYMI